MNAFVQNINDLTGHGNRELRSLAVDVINHALAAAEPYHATHELVHLMSDTLKIGDLSLDLGGFERILVIGAGKATYPIAKALEEILGDRLTGGLVVLKQGAPDDLNKVRVIHGAHPVPDENGHRGAREMMELAESCTEHDLVLAAITGGSSALLPLPVEGVSLADKQRVNELLLFSGADITQINTVRKHLSRLKGGFLAKKIFPATLVNLTVSDVIGDPLDYITCPTVPDSSTFADARKVMDDYDLWGRFPVSASAYLKAGNDTLETPKAFPDQPIHSFIVVNSAVACLAAAHRCQELGFTSMVLTSQMKGEAREAGIFYSAIAREIIHFGRPLSIPCAVIAGGENTVTIQDNHGTGGPNQEFAVAGGIEIAGLDGVVIAALDTDGTDGPTDLAGGLVDGNSVARAHELHLDPARALREHDVTPLLQRTGDGILTGQTGTNINDLKIALVKSI